ncbi:restriction endonuclease [Vibrio parahaemolyticus]|uniref:restriction endonuclease n=1 Tax=Vibrio parahaemolyticus TaxID=670 RepID=UPI001A313460|nr:restriction endonuclease [Vibrio parahaemolyticus]EJG1587793.1 restriction endonuclease [Vibrio parahaemolyticus]HCH0960502.1 restriction endonuclease [Vibrio parahaemolyticus]HCH3521600.1 restriction endonuclease [Vibrio parahaemolyticus]HCH6535963.1 restriction endonuclease [Vibrio parahaemolyticus]
MIKDRAWLDVDFKEIPQGNIANGDQDAFELFARDLLEAVGFKIITGPARGSDDRKDLVVSETRQGILGETEIKFLVSCKHYAHSKQESKAVGNYEEPDLIGRMRNNGCKGFIGFYSTIGSSALMREMTESQRQNQQEFLEFQLFDKSKITDFLHRNSETLKLYKRYFPESFRKSREFEIDSNLYAHRPIINCRSCQKNLIDYMEGYIVKLVKNTPLVRDGEEDWDYPISKVQDILFSCEECFEYMKEDVDDVYLQWPYQIQQMKLVNYTSPGFFIDELMREKTMIRTHEDRYSTAAFHKWSKFCHAMFYFVARPTSKKPTTGLRAAFTRYKL